jgi:hypothetical protein
MFVPLNNSRIGDFVDRIYPIELEIKDTTDTDGSASYLDIQLEIDSKGRLRTKLCDKRDDFNFPIVNFLFICSIIPEAPVYGVYISQLIRYSRACLMWYRRVGTSYSTSDTCRVNVVKNPMISHERGKDREVLTTSGTYPWSFVTIVVCPFVLFLLVIVLSVLRFTNSDCPFGIFKLFLLDIFINHMIIFSAFRTCFAAIFC